MFFTALGRTDQSKIMVKGKTKKTPHDFYNLTFGLKLTYLKSHQKRIYMSAM